MSEGQPASARRVIADSRAVCGRGLVTVAPERKCAGDGFVKENDEVPGTDHWLTTAIPVRPVRALASRRPMFGFDGFVVLFGDGNARWAYG